MSEVGVARHSGRGRGEERCRSFSEVYLEHTPSPSSTSFPTFPLRPLRVAVPAPSTPEVCGIPSTHAHAHGGYSSYASGHVMEGRRLPRFELGPFQISHLEDELRSAYP